MVKLIVTRSGQYRVNDDCYVNYSNQFAKLGQLTPETKLTFAAQFVRTQTGHIKLTYLQHVAVIGQFGHKTRSPLPTMPDGRNLMVGIILNANRAYYQRLGFIPNNYDLKWNKRAQTYLHHFKN